MYKKIRNKIYKKLVLWIAKQKIEESKEYEKKYPIRNAEVAKDIKRLETVGKIERLERLIEDIKPENVTKRRKLLKDKLKKAKEELENLK